MYRNRNLSPEIGVLGDNDDFFWCAHSRHSGIPDEILEREAASGQVNLLAHATETGYSIFESADGRFLMHLGHPEYDGRRLALEWERDRALGRADVEPPRAFDPEAPHTVWRAHCFTLFSQWLEALQTGRHDEPRASRRASSGGPGAR